MRRLIWAFAGCKYHIVGNIMSWLILNIGSYTKANISLNLLNELWKRDKMHGLLSIWSLFLKRVKKFNNTRFYLFFDSKITLKYDFCRKRRHNFVFKYAMLLWTSWRSLKTCKPAPVMSSKRPVIEKVAVIVIYLYNWCYFDRQNLCIKQYFVFLSGSLAKYKGHPQQMISADNIFSCIFVACKWLSTNRQANLLITNNYQFDTVLFNTIIPFLVEKWEV